MQSVQQSAACSGPSPATEHSAIQCHARLFNHPSSMRKVSEASSMELLMVLSSGMKSDLWLGRIARKGELLFEPGNLGLQH